MKEIKCIINKQEVMLPYAVNIHTDNMATIRVFMDKNDNVSGDWFDYCDINLTTKQVSEAFIRQYRKILNITDDQANDYNFICEKFGLYEYMDLNQAYAYRVLTKKIKEYNNGWVPDFTNENQGKYAIAYNYSIKTYVYNLNYSEQVHPKEFYIKDREFCVKLIDNYKWLLHRYFQIERSEQND